MSELEDRTKEISWNQTEIKSLKIWKRRASRGCLEWGGRV